MTDDRGRYRVAGVAPGQYFVSSLIGQIMVNMRMADVPGYAPTYFPGTENAGEARAVTVGLSQVVPGVDFVVKRTTTARIAGVAVRFDGDPIQGNLIMTASERSGALAPIAVGARIGPDGTFEFPNVPPGEYVIRASRDRINTWTEGEFAALFVTVNGSDVTALRANVARVEDLGPRHPGWCGITHTARRRTGAGAGRSRLVRRPDGSSRRAR